MIIPLDERPCNINYVKYLAADTSVELLMPPIKILGNKKRKADYDTLIDWILNNLNGINSIIMSIDMIVYGGIVPSRLHNDSIEVLLKRLSIIERIKKINQFIKIYAFNLIMRNPSYSSSDEEPDYYEIWGRDIHLKGVFEHKKRLGIISEDEFLKLQSLNQLSFQKAFEDYRSRRRVNLLINKAVIDLLANSAIDYLVIPQDDAALYGLTKIDQEVIKNYIKEKNTSNKVIIYPDADAVVNTLFARALQENLGVSKKIFVEYAVFQARDMIPNFEDQPLYKSVSSQIIASGSVLEELIEEADLVLMINATSEMKDISWQDSSIMSEQYNNLRDLEDFIRKAQEYLKHQRKVVIADIAYSNGSEKKLIKDLISKDLYFNLSGYAGWNTSGNTLGTCIPQGIIYDLFGKTKSHLDFLALRYVEDYLYMSKVRQEVTKDYLPKYGLNYFDVFETRGLVAQIVNKKLNEYAFEDFNNNYKIRIIDCFMPWKRMFEVGLDVEVSVFETKTRK
jgi:hypothetical protein